MTILFFGNKPCLYLPVRGYFPINAYWTLPIIGIVLGLLAYGYQYTLLSLKSIFSKLRRFLLVQVLNDINKYFAKHPVRTVNGKNISFSFSGGLTKHLENEDFNATLARADSLVYKVKSLGRKQIIFA